jgi:hypothetical protein
MYEKWLADDGDKLRLTKSTILDLREKIQKVRSGQNSVNDALGDKEEGLVLKEQMLAVRDPPLPPHPSVVFFVLPIIILAFRFHPLRLPRGVCFGCVYFVLY